MYAASVVAGSVFPCALSWTGQRGLAWSIAAADRFLPVVYYFYRKNLPWDCLTHDARKGKLPALTAPWSELMEENPMHFLRSRRRGFLSGLGVALGVCCLGYFAASGPQRVVADDSVPPLQGPLVAPPGSLPTPSPTQPVEALPSLGQAQPPVPATVRYTAPVTAARTSSFTEFRAGHPVAFRRSRYRNTARAQRKGSVEGPDGRPVAQ